jgi:ankyrin repeat protein
MQTYLTLEEVADALGSRNLMVIVCGYAVDVKDASLSVESRLWFAHSLGLPLHTAWPGVPLHQILRDIPSINDPQIMRVLNRETNLAELSATEKQHILETALEFHSDEVSIFLFERFELTAKDVRTYNNYALREAATNGRLLIMQYLVQKFELTADDVRANRNSTLCMAAANGHLPTVEYLVERFKLTVVDVRARNNCAFLNAAVHGHLRMVQYLVERFKLTIDDARDDKNFAIRYAAAGGHLPVVRYLS